MGRTQRCYVVLSGESESCFKIPLRFSLLFLFLGLGSEEVRVPFLVGVVTLTRAAGQIRGAGFVVVFGSPTAGIHLRSTGLIARSFSFFFWKHHSNSAFLYEFSDLLYLAPRLTQLEKSQWCVIYVLRSLR